LVSEPWSPLLLTAIRNDTRERGLQLVPADRENSCPPSLTVPSPASEAERRAVRFQTGNVESTVLVHDHLGGSTLRLLSKQHSSFDVMVALSAVLAPLKSMMGAGVVRDPTLDRLSRRRRKRSSHGSFMLAFSPPYYLQRKVNAAPARFVIPHDPPTRCGEC
jgi:hypothetical protein